MEILEDRLAPAAPTLASPPTVASISPPTAVLGGNVTNDGGLTVQARGVVYSLTSVNSDPTIGGPGVTEVDATPNGDTGAFLVTVGPLQPNSGYSFAAFATNNSGPNNTPLPGYSSVLTFSTVAPTVTISPATSITPQTAVLGGNVTNDGGLTVQPRGVVYSLTSANPDPTVGGPGVLEVDAPPYADRGAFLVTVGGLQPNSGYSFKAFATNNTGPNNAPVTGYSNVATFSTSAGIVMPSSTVTPMSNTDWAVLNQVLFFQPAPGQTLPGSNTPVPQIPDKEITITNNLSTTVYPFMLDASSTPDTAAAPYDPPNPRNIYQGLYDPIDQLYEEYRGYVGYRQDGVNYLGLPPGMTITVTVPLVFWDGARMEIATDGTYLINNAIVGPPSLSPNPFQYYDQNPDGSPTARVALPAVSSSNGPVGAGGQAVTGMVLWYRQGLNNQTERHQLPPQQAKAPANDAPSQLIEWTIRDPVLSIINPNIDKLHPNYGETHANINYDVSYVDSMAVPVALEALDVPVPVQPEPSLDPRIPYPGPRLPYGWIGSPQTPAELQNKIAAFVSNDQTTEGLGAYFTTADMISHGWPQYNLPASAFPGGLPNTKVPSGQDTVYDSPLKGTASTYDVRSNLYMLSSGGTTPIQVVNAGPAYSDGSSTLYLLANSAELQAALEYSLQPGMVVTPTGQGGVPVPLVPPGTTVTSIGPVGNPGFHFALHTFGQVTVMILEVQLNHAIPTSGENAPGYTFIRNSSDYATTALINLWYTWANYYVQHVTSPAQVPNIAGQSLTTDNAMKTNQIKLLQKHAKDLGLVPGMLVTGSTIPNSPPGEFDPKSGIFQLRDDQTGATTIESIDPNDDTIINLSQAVGTSQAGATYSFTAPSMDSPAIVGFNEASPLANFKPTDNEWAGVPHVLTFAQNAYQLLSLISQIPSSGASGGPISEQIIGNVIGGAITSEYVNPDHFDQTEDAYRTRVKSLLRGVDDFNMQSDPAKEWYPIPGVHTGGQEFNVYNLDPFVWFVHKDMGLSGYGFSLDDDTSDVSGNFSTKLGIAIGGLNGLPNQYSWSLAAQYGPVSGTATVTSNQGIAQLPPYVYFSGKFYDVNALVAGSSLQGAVVLPGTSLLEGLGGLYAYSYFLTSLANQPPGQLPSPSNQLQIKSGTSQFTLLGNGTANAGSGTFTPSLSVTEEKGPYMNSLQDVMINAGITLKITATVGSLTSYTQQVEQMARVSIVPTYALDQAGTGPSTFVLNAPLPSLHTIVNGILDVDRVDIADGWLSGTGTVNGSLNVLGPVSGYADPIQTIPVDNEPVDFSWTNLKNMIRGTNGGSLLAGTLGATPGSGTPGTLTVTGDVSLFGASFVVYAAGAGTQGRDYGWLHSDGEVHLGNSQLDLSLIGYTPQTGQSLTIITAAKGITGTFSQGNNIKVNGFTFNITYNANSVVLTVVSPHTAFVAALYRDLLGREPESTGLSGWVQALDSGVSPAEVVRLIWASPEHRGRQVDGLYATYLHRTADPAGRAAWVQAFLNGADETAVAVGFLTSDEYRMSHPVTVPFLNALYGDVLGRTPDPVGLGAWTPLVESVGGWAVVAQAILTSPEGDLRLLDADYTGYLGRPPDDVGRQFWLTQLQNGAISPAGLAEGILSSDEFVAGGGPATS
jgi:hypothetical protein